MPDKHPGQPAASPSAAVQTAILLRVRFDEVRTRIRERTAGFSEEEIAADVAAARAELPD